jgi:hypothetical protein
MNNITVQWSEEDDSYYYSTMYTLIMKLSYDFLFELITDI